MFDKEPARYAPLYGGHCGWGIGKGGYLFPADPLNFKILEDTKQLVVFYRDDEVNTLDYWNDDEVTYKVHGDELWKNKTYALEPPTTDDDDDDV